MRIERRRSKKKKKKKTKPLPRSGLGPKTPEGKEGPRMATRSMPKSKQDHPQEAASTKQPVRRSPRLQGTPATPMPGAQVEEEDREDDKPTFPMAAEPVR